MCAGCFSLIDSKRQSGYDDVMVTSLLIHLFKKVRNETIVLDITIYPIVEKQDIKTFFL